MNHKQTAKEVLELVGGEKNVKQVTHCMTRLRFNLYDESKADKEKLQSTDGVMGVNQSGGQYHVIIGNDVSNVYQAMIADSGLSADVKSGDSEEASKQNVISKLFDFISGVFTPILPAIAGAGMIKGILALMLTFQWISDKSSTYAILTAIGDGAFYFLPILLAVSVAKKIGTNQYIAAAIAAAALHPQLTALLGAGNTEFLGLPLVAVVYSSSVIPILLTIWLGSYVERFAEKYSPKSLKIILVPTVTLLVVVPVMLIAVGPLGGIIGNGLSGGIDLLFKHAGILAGLLIGGFMSPLIITGMHYALLPIMINNITLNGFDFILPMMFVANMAQAGAAFGVFLRSKNKTFKSLAMSTSITALMGITEPAMYGVNMRLKKPFLAALIGAAAGGVFMSIFKVKSYVISGSAGLPGLPTFIGPTFVYSIIGLVIGFVVATIMTLVLGFKDVPVKDDTKADKPEEKKDTVALQNEVVQSPLEGQLKPLNQVNDATFSNEIMGKGTAIVPTVGRVVAPFNGKVETIFQTKHAIGLKSDQGTELLIHVGIDTVKLGGKHFTSHVQSGDLVQAGDLLVEFDIKGIQQEGYDVTTPIIVTNTNDYAQVDAKTDGAITVKETLLTVSVEENEEGIQHDQFRKNIS
ncbi:beta-glucoside-specific PTS transporter subunit IIABC [Bacillus altitudinis]|uniref:beta-glucoside-specific PTS transporter subunit IIABC n=1 Tax=Bacillus altitudinis TaxID=293387 RepID=UPI003F7B5A4B